MQVAELVASGTPDVMQPEESVDSIIRQAVGREPLLCLPRAGESPEQWIQLLHAFDQQGWPLLYPLNLKVHLHKCDKCSHEFCSIVNLRRHIRVHNRFQKLDKDSTKNRNVLGAYWDKLSIEEAKEVVSFENAMLEETPGSSIINALATLIEKQGFFLLPLSYLRSGAALLDIIQSKPSSFPISSQELFSILDDASEKTCFLGTAVSMYNYVFEGDAAKVSLELKNIVACACFLLEQNLTKAWIADKDAESLRCQNQLVEEEEAAQKRQDKILKRKHKKKLRQKQQNAREQRHKDEVETKGKFESTMKTLSTVEASSNTYDFETNNPEKFSSKSPSHVPFQSPDTNEGTDGINQSRYAFDTDQNIERQPDREHSQWCIMQKKAREQRNKGGVKIKGNAGSTLKASAATKVSSDAYRIGARNLKKFANDAPSHAPSQCPDTNEGSDGDAQSGKDFGTDQNLERKSERGQNQGHVEVARWKGLTKSQPAVANDLNTSQNSKISKLRIMEKYGTQGDLSVAAIVNGDKAKLKPEVNSVVLKPITEKEPAVANDLSTNQNSKISKLVMEKYGTQGDQSVAATVNCDKAKLKPEVNSVVLKTITEKEPAVANIQNSKISKLKVIEKYGTQGDQILAATVNGDKAKLKPEVNSVVLKTITEKEPSVANDLSTNQNSKISKFQVMEKYETQGDQSVAAIVNSYKAKPKPEVNSVVLKTIAEKEPAVVKDLITNQNSKISKLKVVEKYGTQGDQSVAAIANVDKAKHKPEVNSVALKTIAEKEPDLVKNHELLIGSISVSVGSCRKSEGNLVASQKDCMAENVAKQNTSQDKPVKPELAESETKQSTVKPQMPVSRPETKDPFLVQSGGTEDDTGYATGDRPNLSGPSLHSTDGSDIGLESKISHLEGSAVPGKSPLQFSVEASKAFLAQRWKEAMASDHVVLVVSRDSESEPSECQETQDLKIAACQSSSCVDSSNSLANAENKLLATSKGSTSKHRKKSRKGAKTKHTPKQKTDT